MRRPGPYVLDFTFADVSSINCTTYPMTFSRSKLPLRATVPNVIVTAILAVTIIFLVACGDGKYQPPAIVVTFYSPPPTSINTDSTIGITAVVTNDPKGAGVNFSCVPAGSCGSFNPPKIASNVPTCYEAPGEVPSGNTVTITATSISDPTKSVTSAAITVLSGSPVQACSP